MSGGTMDLEQKQREEARWRILRVLDAGRPIAVSENIVWRVLHDIRLPMSVSSVRRELDYLRDLGLIEIEGEDTETWYAKLTARGVDVVEYTLAAPAGVARPRKYW
jgi:DNA-binding transcriptional ArsR family regulator